MKGLLKEDVFTREVAIRHLFMLGTSVAVFIWFYIAMALFTGDNKWMVSSTNELSGSDSASFVNTLSLFIWSAGVIGCLVYINIKKWMLPLLKEAVIALIGWLPLIRVIDPVFRGSAKYERDQKIKQLKKKLKLTKFRSDDYKQIKKEIRAAKREYRNYKDEVERERDQLIREEIRENKRSLMYRWAVRSERKFDEEYYGEYYNDEHYYAPIYGRKGIFARTWDALMSLFRRLLYGVLCFVGAIIIPLSSPIIMIVIYAVLTSVLHNSQGLTIINTLLIGVMVLVYIVHPVFVMFVKK